MTTLLSFTGGWKSCCVEVPLVRTGNLQEHRAGCAVCPCPLVQKKIIKMARERDMVPLWLQFTTRE